jgi:alternate signal-mediated exported protein
LGTQGTIQSGKLDLTVSGSAKGEWYLVNPESNTANLETDGSLKIANIDGFVISPGDQLVYKGMSYTGYVWGSDIKAELNIGGDVGDALADAVRGDVKVEFKVGAAASPGAVVLQGTTADPYAYLSGTGSNSAVAVDVYITFDKDASAATTQGVSEAIKFTGTDGLKLVLQQVAA